MAGKPQIAIVGPGRMGGALAAELSRAGYRVREIISREGFRSRRRARSVARMASAGAVTTGNARLDADLIWFCVPDREIASVARSLASRTRWKGKIAFHSSGALPADELRCLRQRGAAIAAVHPFMTFVHGAIPALAGVPWGVEGDAAAVRVARRLVSGLGGKAFSIAKNRKSAYHAWGAFTSPLLVALLVTAEHAARAAGFSRANARKYMLPILRQTLANYERLGAAEAFSGPLVRGDVEVVRKHLRILQTIGGAKEVYAALARAAVRALPVERRQQIEKALR